jgi:phage gpG-like protein
MNYFVNVDISGVDPRQIVKGVEQRLENLKPFLQVLPEQVIFPSVRKSFAAQGRPTWEFKGFQSSPPMVKSGLMKRGLTSRDTTLNTITITDNTLTFQLNPSPYIIASRRKGKGSTGVFYPGIHQHGGSRHYQNVILNLQPEDIEKMEEMLLNYLTTGKVAG